MLIQLLTPNHIDLLLKNWSTT